MTASEQTGAEGAVTSRRTARGRTRWTLVALVTALVVLVGAGVWWWAGSGSEPATTRPVLISRGVPAFTSADPASAAAANDDDYASAWTSEVPGWLAYDLSEVPAAQRGRVLAAWSNPSYGYTTRFGPHYNNLGAYTIATNTAKGGGEPPTSGWQERVRVEDNDLHSRQHVLDLGGADWVRLEVTASDGSAQNLGASTNVFDLYDLGGDTGPVEDSFIFFGDSITAGAMCPCPLEDVASLPELVHDAHPSRWPVMENGGDPFETSGGAVDVLLGEDGHLSRFPGKYVGLSYGMNDAASSIPTETFAANMTELVQAVVDAGKVPLVPTISATDQPAVNEALPAYNAVIEQLYEDVPQVVRGPDLWTWFSEHPELVAKDDIHPTAEGYAALRTRWAEALLGTVYAGDSTAPVAAAADAPPSDPAPRGLHTSGNRIVDEDGEPVRLIGVNHSGTEYACVGGSDAKAEGYGIFEPADFGTEPAYLDAIRSWGTNTLRMGLNEACWLGINGVSPEHSGQAYRDSIRAFVDRATRAGLVVVLELHWSAPGEFLPHGQSPMPNRDHTPDLWASVAETFKGNTAVVFDLFNEPYPGSNQDTANAWECWRDGSAPGDDENRTRCLGTEWWDTAGNAFNGGKPVTYEVAGMQELVDAVRDAGADNLVLLSGLQYANTLSGWLEHAPDDPADNLAAAWHVYPVNGCSAKPCWDEQVAPVAEQVPLVTAEVGDEECRTSFVAPVLDWLDERDASYLAWTWNAWGCEGLQLMTDYRTGRPTEAGRVFHDRFREVTGLDERD